MFSFDNDSNPIPEFTSQDQKELNRLVIKKSNWEFEISRKRSREPIEIKKPKKTKPTPSQKDPDRYITPIIYCVEGTLVVGDGNAIGCYFGPDDKRNVFESIPGNPSIQSLGLLSLKRALETLPDNGVLVEIRSDSQYIRGVLNGNETPNPEITSLVWEVNELIRRKTIVLKWIKFNKEPGNVEANKLLKNILGEPEKKKVQVIPNTVEF